MLQASTFQFLKKLKNNNNKTWFDTNKKLYEAAKLDFEKFVTQLIAEFATINSSYSELTAKQCIFRINRDVRFSKNKDPYKSNFGASINLGGKKSTGAGFYIHIEPGNCFVGGGIYMPQPDVLSKIRQEIDYNFKEFEQVVLHKTFKKYYTGGLDLSDSLKNAPKGYDNDNEALTYLKLKSFIAMQNIDDALLSEKNAVKKVVEYKKALQGLIDFLNKAVA